jgi:hypothetical protein
MIPIGPLFQLQYSFLVWLKPIRGPQRSVDFFCAALENMFCMFTEIAHQINILEVQKPVVVLRTIHFRQTI